MTLARFVKILALSAATAMLAAAPVRAAQMFMKIENVPGESRDATHAGWIEISSFQWGQDRGGSMAMGSGRESSRSGVHEITVTKQMDKASQRLMQAQSTGSHFKEVVIDDIGHGKTVRITLTDVLIAGFQTSAGGQNPLETIKFDFAKSEISYPSSLDRMQNMLDKRTSPPMQRVH